MNIQQLAKLKRQTMQIYSSLQRYESFKKTMAATADMYQNDFLFYNDSVQERHRRNIYEIKKIIEALRQKKMTPDMIQFNTVNSFFPSYVLSHHYNQFTKLAISLSQTSKALNTLLRSFLDFSAIGAIFQKTINLNFKKSNTPITIQNDTIKMEEDVYFYSFKTSPYVDICCFEANKNNKNVIVFVQLKNKSGDYENGVKVRDMGALISPDYVNIGFNFNGVRPAFVIESEKCSKTLRDNLSVDAVMELGYSINDLINSLHITVKYTQMRKQFSTYEQKKQQRPLLQYQAVSARIADGFATLYGISFLRQRFLNMPIVGAFMKPYLPFMHQVVLERLIQLRECCGGFGYLQMSGHPAFLERVSLRAAEEASTYVPQNNQIMKRLHYYSSDITREPDYIKQITQNSSQIENVFYYFVIICMRMRQTKQNLNPRFYIKQFLKQACIQMMYSSTYFDPIDPGNPFETLVPFMIVKHVINQSKYLHLAKNLEIQSFQSFHETLLQKRTKILDKISSDIPRLCLALEVGKLRNVVVGQADQKQFYNQVMEVSQNNKRNSPQYLDYALQNLKNVIREQRASL